MDLARRSFLFATLLFCIALCVAAPSRAQTPGRSAMLVFIADDVPEADRLAAGVVSGDDVVRLSDSEDAIAQIGRALSVRREVGTIVVVSHGSPGALQFGSSRVDADGLALRTAELRGWRASLAAGADVLLYGCDVGAGSIGAQFVSTLSALTGADVAASTNPTGGTAGSDWILERRVGHVTAPAPWSQGVMANWGHRLIVVTEPPDISNSVATAPVYVLTSGANTVSGTVMTPTDGQDNFQVTVPAGFRLTAVSLVLNTSGGFNGSVTFNLNETRTTSGNFTVGLPLGPGTYYMQVVANFSVGNAWSTSFTLSAFATCGNGITEAGETCDDGNTVACDGCSATCTAAVNGCLIGGVCVAEGTASPGNACLVCARAVSRTSYSPVSNGTACNDGNACTRTDTCQAGACTGASPVTCTAADPCHLAGVCNTATGVCSQPNRPNGTACNDGNACSQTDTCQTGVCTGANPVTCTAADQCHVAGACNPATGVCSQPTRPNGTACSDGLFCTAVDTCNSGVCTGAARDCSDALSCTTDSCNETASACVHPVTTGCLIAGACVAEGGADPGNACLACRAAMSTTAFSPVTAGSTCNDGMFCTTTDVCDGAGTCTGTARDCNDGDRCTVDTCGESAGACSSTPLPGCADAGADAEVDAGADAAIDAISEGGSRDSGGVIDGSSDAIGRDVAEAGVRRDGSADGSDGDGGTGAVMRGCGCRVGSTSSGGRPLVLTLLLALSVVARRRRSGRSGSIQ